MTVDRSWQEQYAAKFCTAEQAIAMLSPGRRLFIGSGVTEYGAVNLWGRSIRQRTEALIGIAHRDFRAELRSAAVARRYVFVAE